MMKRVVEIFVACLLLILCAPIMAFIAILIRLDNDGPVLYKQVRMGMGFRHFYRYKFRIFPHFKSTNLDEAVMDGVQPFTRIGENFAPI